MSLRLGGALLAVALGGLPVCAGESPPPTVIFVLLDTMRADRLSALGYDRPTTPALDALAAHGALFARHYANAHATRSSMPQLMSGRYYHRNILGPFQPEREPREYPFNRPDPTAILLPELLRRHGYQTLGVSAHWWVIAQSFFGSHFDRLDLIDVDARLAHADATEVTDRALALWRARDPSRPLFLYLHYMDMHLPRFIPDDGLEVAIPGYDWKARFRPSGEPLFDRERRRWDRADASDFTQLDRRHFAAVYDARVRHTDNQLARLLAAVRADDPELRDTLIVVTADHGEELGEDGRTDHTDSLAEAVQHIPWIMTGRGVAAGQRVPGLTANVDVLPTVLAALGLPLPAGVRVDGRAQLDAEGRVVAEHERTAVYYAWEDYRAVRSGRYLFRQNLEGSGRARCLGREILYRLEGARRDVVDQERDVAERLGTKLTRQLERRDRAYRERRYGPPHASFFVVPDYWRVASAGELACVLLGVDTDRSDLDVPGWAWTGRGLTIFEAAGGALPVVLPAPNGDYLVEAAAVPVPVMPWFFRFGRWLRKAFLPDRPTAYEALGTFRTTSGELSVPVPTAAGTARHLVAFRLTPVGTEPTGAAPIDAGQRERLRALGYVD